MRAHDRPRREFIGASEAAAMGGIDPYLTRFDLWALKTGRIPEPDPEENPLLRAGTYLEPIMREQELPRRADVVDVVAPEEGEFYLEGSLGAHPDGRIRLLGYETYGALEIKWLGKEMWNAVREGGLSPHYVVQLNTTIGALATEYGAFAVGNRDTWETLLFPMPFDRELFDWARQEADAFKATHIDADVAPELFPPEPPPEIPALGGSLVLVSPRDEEWTDLMDEYQELVEVRQVIDSIWPEEEKIRKAIQKAEEAGADRELTLKERIQAKMVRLKTEEAAGHGWKWFYRPGATRKQFLRELVTMLGPFDPEQTQRVLEDEIEGLLPSAGQNAEFVAAIMHRLRMEAHVGGDDPRFFEERIQPYFRAYPYKD